MNFKNWYKYINLIVIIVTLLTTVLSFIMLVKEYRLNEDYRKINVLPANSSSNDLLKRIIVNNKISKLKHFYILIDDTQKNCVNRFIFVYSMHELGKVQDYRNEIKETRYYCEKAEMDFTMLQYRSISQDIDPVLSEIISLLKRNCKLRNEIVNLLYENDKNDIKIKGFNNQINNNQKEAEVLYNNLYNKL